jgi:hypothetical protein
LIVPSWRLTILAALSLGLFTGLLCGYVATVEIFPYRAIFSGATVEVYDCPIEIGGGCCFIGAEHGTVPAKSMAGYKPGLHFRTAYRLGLPSAVSLWHFEAGVPGSANGRGFFLMCPIWCLALPCTIAPILWLRRRRHRRARGFTVEPLTTANGQ